MIRAGARGMMAGVQASHELFDHTADMGIRVRASSPGELIRPAIEGLYAAIGELVPAKESVAMNLTLAGGDRAGLLREVLNEALILFERDGRMLTDVEGVEFTEHRLTVSARSAAVDAERSVFHREVKAITYHELAIRAIEGGFEATVIVDI